MQNISEQTRQHVLIFAGPNGSGKTTLIDEIKDAAPTPGGSFPIPALFINPDQVAKDLKGEFADQDARDLAAARAAVAMRSGALASRQPFAFETVMSHPARLSEMMVLKEQGYQLFLTFITTDRPEKNVDRVTKRYQTNTTTGHYVPPATVIERYQRTLALLPKAAEIADAVFIYDNSVDFQTPVLQVAIERGHGVLIAPDVLPWVQSKVIAPLQARESALAQLVEQLHKLGQPVLAQTDELDGNYSGPVLMSTPHFVVQRDAASGQAVIHDRLMLDTAHKGLGPIYTDHEALTIVYSRTGAPQRLAAVA
jgi:predicted ABC-type ATPase